MEISTALLRRMWPRAPIIVVNGVAMRSADVFGRYGLTTSLALAEFARYRRASEARKGAPSSWRFPSNLARCPSGWRAFFVFGDRQSKNLFLAIADQ